MERTRAALKFLFFSAVGIFMFFIPIKLNNTSSIPLDHIVTWIRNNLTQVAIVYGLLVTIIGAVFPWITKIYKKSKTEFVFAILKILGAVIAVLVYFKAGPSWMMRPDIGPFLLNRLVVPVGLIVPIGSVFLAFLVGYGLMEFTGSFLRPVMRTVFKTPGRSAIDAVASFVGSYSIALLITNKVFKEGKYTIREAAIIATGFSTVSATFMIIVARTLKLMDMWNKFFWSTLFVTFVVTAITARLWPLSKKKDDYIGTPNPEHEIRGNLFAVAWNEALATASKAPGLLQGIWQNLKAGFRMALTILPTIMSVGFIGLVLATYTPVFDAIAWIFYPFTALLRLPEAFLVAKASAVEIAEMFLPALLTVNASLISRFVVGVVSISAILFFSASIPCILSTEIPITIPELLIIWIERTILSLIIATAVAWIIL
ncbi:YjiH family protein [Pseudothermotoga thermarum]|uniref:Nucleoside recognition domain protein n=1 Tax=Pseudothermotoga thermarum DSM 5069 TaxID=688269 RepID=F7YVR3_9THEM|nr:YjiH family protein [Pseudothermotoga thermarum]AEH51729.1 nucleoside recognition domain protein [Pseudothermotoga thermarum DSM 5069]